MTPYRILVTGSRAWKDPEVIRTALYRVCAERGFDRCVVVHGLCPRGADAVAEKWARDHAYLGVRVERHVAVWEMHGKAAGRIRNQHMVDLGADLCLAFATRWASGTGMCARMARAAGIPVVDQGVSTASRN